MISRRKLTLLVSYSPTKLIPARFSAPSPNAVATNPKYLPRCTVRIFSNQTDSIGPTVGIRHIVVATYHFPVERAALCLLRRLLPTRADPSHFPISAPGAKESWQWANLHNFPSVRIPQVEETSNLLRFQSFGVALLIPEKASYA